jgi:hypothetical protein
MSFQFRSPWKISWRLENFWYDIDICSHVSSCLFRNSFSSYCMDWVVPPFTHSKAKSYSSCILVVLLHFLVIDRPTLHPPCPIWHRWWLYLFHRLLPLPWHSDHPWSTWWNRCEIKNQESNSTSWHPKTLLQAPDINLETKQQYILLRHSTRLSGVAKHGPSPTPSNAPSKYSITTV